MIRAVLDPGVLIAALISPQGAPADLLLLWLDGAFELVASPKLLTELRDVLSRPKFQKYVSAEEVSAYLVILERLAIVVRDPAEVSVRTSDPKDDYLFALATSASAAVLVSGDTHILETGDEIVMTPREFLIRIA